MIGHIGYEPTFEIAEEIIPDIGNRKINHRTRAIINYEVVEKTRSFTILKVTSICHMPSARRL